MSDIFRFVRQMSKKSNDLLVRIYNKLNKPEESNTK